MAIVPASLTDEYTEYKRRYDILANYRQYADDAFFKDIEKHVSTLLQQIATARTESDKKVAEIDRQLAELREAFNGA